MRSILVLAAIALTFASCTKEPEASFTFSPTSAVVGEPVTFTNTSLEGVSYSWDFGDGTTSEEASPTKTYTTAGSYQVKLTAYSKKEKKSDVYEQYITVEAPPLKVAGTMNGSPFSMYMGQADVMAGYSASSSLAPCGSMSSTIPHFALYNEASNETWYVSKGTLYFDCDPPTNAQFKAFFTPGTYSFSNASLDGFEVQYFDASGEEWNTSFGSQTGTFTITKREEIENFLGYYIQIEGTFNCTLYNAAGEEKVITNGFTRAEFQNMY